MSANKIKSLDYKTISPKSKETGASGRASFKHGKSPKKEEELAQSLKNPYSKSEPTETVKEETAFARGIPPASAEETFSQIEDFNQTAVGVTNRQQLNKQQKKIEKDERLLSRDRWLAHDGHTLTYAGIFLFTLIVYFRPYDWIPGLSSFNSMALVVAVATLLIYLPTQFTAEGSLTTLPTEIKCVLFLGLWALLTIPIAKNPSMAWTKFSEDYIKIVVIFVVMVNTLRTKSRLKGLMWLSIGVGVMLSYQAIGLYREGVFRTEGYRVSVDFGGMFSNPNDMALHLVIFTPIAIALGIASKNKLSRLVYFASAGMMVIGNMVTQSRGGFLGLLAVSVVLVWKFGKKQRFKTILVSLIIGLLVMAFAPGNYGLRVLSIFVPSLDPVGSSEQRKELLIQSLWATLSNPQGLGIGNFPVISIRNLETHNAYTQISSELGWLAFAAYVILLISPLRKLGAVERQMFAREDFSWIYYLSIGIQASIIGYMVSSFFGPVAYNWFVYYPIAYAVCLRRIYQAGQAEKGISLAEENGLSDYFKRQTA